MVKTDVLIIGGGVAGLSTAYFLGKSGQKNVIVLEQEKELGGHASGRNAGMLRQALPDPMLVQLARDSRKYFDKLESHGWKSIALKKNGSLILSKESKRAELEAIEKTIREAGIASEWLPRWKVVAKVPVLGDADFSIALFCPSDAMLDLDPLLEGFLRNLKRMRIKVVCGLKMDQIVSVKNGFEVRAGGKLFYAKKIVNAAGAWASWVAEEAGAAQVPLASYRRHLFFTNQVDKESSRWPFVWDVNLDFYFRPMDQKLLISPCDKQIEKEGDRREKINPAARTLLLDKMKKFSNGVNLWKVNRVISGLRTMTPDGRFVVGADRLKKNFYWVAGLGGHGVTTCFAVGRMAANAVLGRKNEKELEGALSPGRFVK